MWRIQLQGQKRLKCHPASRLNGSSRLFTKEVSDWVLQLQSMTKMYIVIKFCTHNQHEKAQSDLWMMSCLIVLWWMSNYWDKLCTCRSLSKSRVQPMGCSVPCKVVGFCYQILKSPWSWFVVIFWTTLYLDVCLTLNTQPRLSSGWRCSRCLRARRCGLFSRVSDVVVNDVSDTRR